MVERWKLGPGWLQGNPVPRWRGTNQRPPWRVCCMDKTTKHDLPVQSLEWFRTERDICWYNSDSIVGRIDSPAVSRIVQEPTRGGCCNVITVRFISWQNDIIIYLTYRHHRASVYLLFKWSDRTMWVYCLWNWRHNVPGIFYKRLKTSFLPHERRS